MESGLRPAAAQLENRQRRFGVRLLSLPRGDQAREIAGATAAIGRRLMNALAYSGRTENTFLLEEPETLDAELLQEEEEAKAKAEAEKSPPGLTTFTDGSRLDDGAAGYAANPGWVSKPTWDTTRRARCLSGSAGSGKRRGRWREELGTGGELFLPTPSFMAPAEE